MLSFDFQKKNFRILTILFAVILIVTATFSDPEIANAASVGNGTAYVNSSSGVNLRKSFSTSSKKVALLSNGTKITLIRETFATKTSYSTNQRWFYVKANGYNGYIRADLLKNFSYSSATATVTSSVNYRSGAGTGMKLQGVLSKGKQVEAVLVATPYGSDDVWYKIKISGKYYYVSGKWLKFSATSAVKTPTFENTDLVYPKTIYKGASFAISGQVKCDQTIEKVKFGIVDSSNSWVQSKTENVNAKTFDIKKVDPDLKFGSLPIGSYTYKGIFYVGGQSYTKISYDFKVAKANGPDSITKKAFELAWGVSTPSTTYSYSGGSPTVAFKTALDAVYPSHNSWGAGPRTGASCDVFVGTVIRSSGYDTTYPRGLGETWNYLANSDKWREVSATKANLQSGDIILYATSSAGHTCIYVEKNGVGYIAEAAYQRNYGFINGTSAVSSRISTSGKTKVKVYRAVK